jgi:hypothetical protein
MNTAAPPHPDLPPEEVLQLAETQERGHRTLARLRSQGRNERTASNGGTRA